MNKYKTIRIQFGHPVIIAKRNKQTTLAMSHGASRFIKKKAFDMVKQAKLSNMINGF